MDESWFPTQHNQNTPLTFDRPTAGEVSRSFLALVASFGGFTVGACVAVESAQDMSAHQQAADTLAANGRPVEASYEAALARSDKVMTLLPASYACSSLLTPVPTPLVGYPSRRKERPNTYRPGQ